MVQVRTPRYCRSHNHGYGRREWDKEPAGLGKEIQSDIAPARQAGVPLANAVARYLLKLLLIAELGMERIEARLPRTVNSKTSILALNKLENQTAHCWFFCTRLL